MNKYGLISLLLAAICLGWYASSLSEDLNVAKKENKTLLTAVEGRDETITALQEATGADRRATEEQLKIEQQKRAKADVENEKLRKVLEKNGCGNKQLPDDVRRILRREAEAITNPAVDLRVSTGGTAPAM